MSMAGEIYLAVVVCAFLLFIGTLFWGMVSTSGLSDPTASYQAQKPADADRGHHPDHH